MTFLSSKILIACALLLCSAFAQDIEPGDLLDYPTTTTPSTTTVQTTMSTSSMESTSATITTDAPTTEVETSSSAPATTTTEIYSSTSPATSTSTEVVSPTTTTSTTTAPSTISPQPTTLVPTTSPSYLAPTTTTVKPKKSTLPPCWNCYYKEQLGYPHLEWTPLGLKYVHTLNCFRCCRFAGYEFAGCTQVNKQICDDLYDRSKIIL